MSVARVYWSTLLLLTVVAVPSAAPAADYETIWVEPGQNVDVYWEVNLSGKVFLAADTAGQPACLNYWWITWPWGRNVELGRHCGRAAFELPGLSNLSVGGKLRAGGADAKTRIRGTADESVSNHFPELSF